MKRCPYCAEEIQDAAIKCRWCQSMLRASEPEASDEVSAGHLVNAEAPECRQEGHDTIRDADGIRTPGVSDKDATPGPPKWLGVYAVLAVMVAIGFLCWGIVQQSGSERAAATPHKDVAAIDPAALRVIKFIATETYAHDETPETETPFAWWEVANASSVTLEGVGEIPCEPEGLKRSPSVCIGGPTLSFVDVIQAKGARKKALEAVHAAFARATSVTLTARGVDGKTLTTTVPVKSIPMPVEYVVTTRGDGGSVTVANPETGATEQAKVYKSNGGRWRESYGRDVVVGERPIREGAWLYLSAQNGDEGCVSVKIYIHNIEAKSAQSCGEYTIATVNTNYVSPETLARLQADGRGE